jgi:hypothetical protein
MSLHVDLFDYTVGTEPPGWTQHGTGPWLVSGSAPAENEKCLRWVVPSTNATRSAAWTDSPTGTHQRMVARRLQVSGDAFLRGALTGRMSGTDRQCAGAFLAHQGANPPALVLARWDGSGNRTELGTVNVSAMGSSSSVEVYHFIEIEHDGTMLRARAWLEGAARPDWLITHASSGALASGYAGVFCSAFNTGGVEFDYIRYTTDGSDPFVTTSTAPTADTLTAASAGYSQVDLTITPGTGATSRTLHRSTTSGLTPGAGNQIASLGLSDISYSDTGLSQDTTYYYRTLATNAEGSTPSNQASATTAAYPFLPAPVLLSPANGATATQPVTLQWGAVTDPECP